MREGRRRGLLVTTDWPPRTGGISRLLGSLVRLSSQEIEWRVLTLSEGPDEDHVVRHSGVGSLLQSVPREAAWLRAGRDSRIVCGHLFVLPAAMALGWTARAPVATLVYGSELLAKGRRYGGLRRLLPRSDVVVAISSYSAQRAADLGVPKNRIHVVRPLLPPPWIRPHEPDRRPRGRGLRMVSLTRLREGYKNLELILRAVSILMSRGAIDRYTIIGDGPRLEALRDKGEAFGVRDVVEFAGGVDDSHAARLLFESDLGLFPSRYSIAEGGFEGFGLVVHEMAAAGLPVLAGAAGGTPEACDPAWSVLLPPDDLRSWVLEIQRLTDDEPRRLEMARRALAWARGVDGSETVASLVRAFWGAAGNE
jgi:phosphatidylinositol alpha-1,6-mannosyltransferase